MAVISLKLNEDFIETEKAICVKVKNHGHEAGMWLPKSLINKDYKRIMRVDVPEKIYIQKIDELFQEKIHE